MIATTLSQSSAKAEMIRCYGGEKLGLNSASHGMSSNRTTRGYRMEECMVFIVEYMVFHLFRAKGVAVFLPATSKMLMSPLQCDGIYLKRIAVPSAVLSFTQENLLQCGDLQTQYSTFRHLLNFFCLLYIRVAP